MPPNKSSPSGSEPTNLADFIRRDCEALVDEFADFARTHLASATRLSPEELRDSAATMLRRIADDIESRQTESGRGAKSRGETPLNSPDLTDEAKGHANDRLVAHFSLTEMVSEYRALRASVVRRWRGAGLVDSGAALEEIVRFNEAIDQALTESIAWYASRTSRARELMAGMIAHDLRNPLGAITMSAHYLLRSEALKAPASKAASRILTSAGTMEKMVADLLDFTQVRMGGHLSVRPAPMSFRDVCKDAVSELRAFYPERTIELDVSDDLEGYWDAARLRQVVSNLVANSLNHGAPDSTVAVSASRSEKAAQLDVHNFGEPIPFENQADLFDPLKRLPDNAAHWRKGGSGLGLGLFIVKEIAQAHGGSVSVASNPDEGTTFTVQLPFDSITGARRQ